MIKSFEYQNYKYKYIRFSELEEYDKIYFPKEKKYNKRSKYLDIGCGFDIETSRIENKHLSFMYIWMFSLNDLVIYGRTWEELGNFMEFLKDYYNLDENQKLIVWVHNLSFEFQFIKKRMAWNKGKNNYPNIFALSPRKIVKACIDGIEFRDSLSLTNLSLKKMAEDYNLFHKKLVGDLDYSILRHSESKLIDAELAYCFNDVLILADFQNKYIYEYFIKRNIKLPLTSTGIVRDELKRNFKNLIKKKRLFYQKKISTAFPEFEIYKIMREYLYRGGYVHSAPGLSDQVLLYDLGSEDFKSAYPAYLLQNKFPMTFIEADPDEYIKAFDKRITKEEAFFGLFEFKNIKSKGLISYESSNKILEYKNAVWDNGRLWKADSIKVWVNEDDLQIYEDVYNYEEIKCFRLFKSRKEYLPKYVLNLILKYYATKEKIGKISKDSIEYKNAKSRLNSIYGMMCTSLYFMEYHYIEEIGQIQSVPTEKEYNELINDQILLPQWGIWTTSGIRFRLIHYGFMKCGKDAIYGDTDSIKLINFYNNEYVFKNFNNMIKRINSKMYVADYDRKLFQEIGFFDYEGKILKFKTLGAKRYLYSQVKKDKESGKYHISNISTIAGMKKGTLDEYSEANDINIYDAFKEGLILDLSFSKKLTSIYNDEYFEESVTDAEGTIMKISEESCVTLIEIPYKLNIATDYLLFIDKIKEMNQNRLIHQRFTNQFY